MLTIDCDLGIAQELSDYFSFFVPGYKFMPAFKAKVWDGKIRLYNSMNGELSSGLYVYVIKFCAERKYSMDTIETAYGLPAVLDEINEDHLLEFYHLLNMPYTPREYQHDAVMIGLRRKNAILLSPTGSGKSLIMYILMRYILATCKNKILIIVPTTSLVEQLYKDVSDYGYDADAKVHRIYSGKDKDTNKRVIISTWQAKYRFGLTGTLDGTQTHKLVLEGLFGPVYQVTKTKTLQDAGDLAQLKITMLMLKYADETRLDNTNNDYQKEIEFIIKHEGRNKFIRNLALNQKGNTLVLYLRVEGHGKPLFDMIQAKASEGRKVFFVSGDVDAKVRETIRGIVETQSDAIIVASLGTFSTGINIRNLHNIVFASPSKSQIKVLQSIGRGLRKSDNDTTTQLFDIADDLHWKAKKNFTLLHSAERVKIYHKEQFDYKIVQVDIE